jgi:hypothetical protein
MGYILTPDSPSYQDIALRVAVRDVLSGFDRLKTTQTDAIVRILAPSVEALRIAHADLVSAPWELRLSVSSFIYAFDFTASIHPALSIGAYLQSARQRLYAAVAAPDSALVASQEASLRGAITDFLAAYETLQDTAAPARRSNPQDFPDQPALPRNRLKADWTQMRQTGQAARTLRQTDRALASAYANLTYAPLHLRLAVSHWLMTWQLLGEYAGNSTPLDHARQSLKRSFDPTTVPAPSVYLSREPALVE